MSTFLKKMRCIDKTCFLSMKLFGDRTIRERITKLSEYISFCWAFLYSVSKDWKITKEEINTNSHGYARGGASCITISLRG